MSLLERASQKPVLIVLCGPSHVGKTTFARQLSEVSKNFAIISPDKIRKQLSVRFGDFRHESKVWDIYESMKCKALRAGRNVILDACHISKQARWHALQGPNSNYKKICVVFDLPWQTIRERCLSEKRVSLEEVERMWQAFQHNKPSPEELKLHGFDVVCFMTVEEGCRGSFRQRCFILPPPLRMGWYLCSKADSAAQS
ncbi:MAG: AAA family ATPase [Planctomycetota bacterium]|jgi:predicted kinase